MRLVQKEQIRKMRNRVIKFFSKSKPNPDIEVSQGWQECLDKQLCEICEKAIDETYFYYTRDIMSLLRQGASPNAKDKYGNTPLIYVSRGGLYKAAKVMLNQGAKANERNNRGITALMWAAHYGKTKTCELLLENNAGINARDNEGRNALIFSAILHRSETCKLLVSKGADISVSDIYGKTALAYAKENQPYRKDAKETATFLSKLIMGMAEKMIGEENFDLFMANSRECIN